MADVGFNGYCELMPVPVFEFGRGENGWEIEHMNRLAGELCSGREDELLGSLSEALAAGADKWRTSLWDRELFGVVSYPDEKRAIAAVRDITDDIPRLSDEVGSANAALRSALDAANAANRAKTDFLSNMSHDIRTPLNAIIGMTTIAEAHLDERERLADCLEKIGLSSKHLLAIINDILDMSRIESGKMTVSSETFTMADFIHSLMAVFRPNAEAKRQKILLDFTGIVHEEVLGDPLRIQQVLVNILSNAVKFTPEEGTISLTVRETAETISGDRKFSYYEFTVQDTGIGMDREFIEKIFLPFERDKNVHHIEGTGLGMAITQNLVKMMNGEITVESEKGKGTKFTVTLPLEQLERAEGGFEALRGLKVLAADIDAASLDSLKRMLGDFGMECDAVASGWEAQDLAAKAHIRGEDYFAILLGWRLPVVDGVQTCREIRAIVGKKTPIIIMSSYEWKMTADEMHKYGVSEFLPKPLFRSRLGELLYSYTDEGRTARNKSENGDSESFAGSRILLVEDNEINREIGVELIGMLGAEVECAENGRVALEMFRDSPAGKYDLIFMDIQMPEMDGFEATRAIRALSREDGKTIPIVAMSANAFVDDIRACKRAGMNAHVPKPVSIQSLAETMSRFLHGGGEPVFDAD